MGLIILQGEAGKAESFLAAVRMRDGEGVFCCDEAVSRLDCGARDGGQGGKFSCGSDDIL